MTEEPDNHRRGDHRGFGSQEPNGPGSPAPDVAGSPDPDGTGKPDPEVDADIGSPTAPADGPAEGETVPQSDRLTDSPPTDGDDYGDASAEFTAGGGRIGTVSGQATVADETGVEIARRGSVEGPSVETAPRERSRSGRARGMELVAAGLIAIGIVTGTAEAFLMTVPLLLGIVYHRVTELPDIDLEASRDFSQVSVVPGETVTVSVTVTNSGGSSIPDLRIRDDVPDRLSVVEGTPMASVSLEPGGAATLSYRVTARRGMHEFRDVEVICRNVSGSERERQILAAPRTLVAASSLAGMPLDARASQYTGRLETSYRGSGVEFHSTREYHPSDSPRNIDWRTFAKTREFTTIEYKDTRAASIHLVVDNREATNQHTGANAVTSRELCLYAGEQVAEYLIEDRHQVGVSTISDATATHFPEKGPNQYRRVRREFASGADGEREGEGNDLDEADAQGMGTAAGVGVDEAESVGVDEAIGLRLDEGKGVGEEAKGVGVNEAKSLGLHGVDGVVEGEPEGRHEADGNNRGSDAVDETLADEFVANTASHTQFVCFSGLYDDGFDGLLDRLARHGRPVLVISPRQELVSTPGSQLTALKRHVRIETLRRDGVRVLDWDTDEPLRLAIQRRVGGLWK